jgi:osmotically-inducible protein OsmY
MKSDIQIQKDVIEELRWEPFLDSAEIGVAVKNGVVNLSGEVDSYSKKMAAEDAAKRVSGVKAIAEDIQITVFPHLTKTDREIADAVLNALKWHSGIQEEKVKVKVEDGHVRVEGEVEWEYQRTSVTSAIANLVGVRSVTNMITVKPKIKVTDIQQKISAALHRSATVDAGKIKVEVSGSKVTLRGTVRSLAEKRDAEMAAWSAPGAISVDSRLLVIEQPEFAFDD